MVFKIGGLECVRVLEHILLNCLGIFLNITDCVSLYFFMQKKKFFHKEKKKFSRVNRHVIAIHIPHNGEKRDNTFISFRFG